MPDSVSGAASISDCRARTDRLVIRLGELVRTILFGVAVLIGTYLITLAAAALIGTITKPIIHWTDAGRVEQVRPSSTRSVLAGLVGLMGIAQLIGYAMILVGGIRIAILWPKLEAAKIDERRAAEDVRLS